MADEIIKLILQIQGQEQAAQLRSQIERLRGQIHALEANAGSAGPQIIQLATSMKAAQDAADKLEAKFGKRGAPSAVSYTVQGASRAIQELASAGSLGGFASGVFNQKAVGDKTLPIEQLHKLLSAASNPNNKDAAEGILTKLTDGFGENSFSYVGNGGTAVDRSKSINRSVEDLADQAGEEARTEQLKAIQNTKRTPAEQKAAREAKKEHDRILGIAKRLAAGSGIEEEAMGLISMNAERAAFLNANPRAFGNAWTTRRQIEAMGGPILSPEAARAQAKGKIAQRLQFANATDLKGQVLRPEEIEKTAEALLGIGQAEQARARLAAISPKPGALRRSRGRVPAGPLGVLPPNVQDRAAIEAQLKANDANKAGVAAQDKNAKAVDRMTDAMNALNKNGLKLKQPPNPPKPNQLIWGPAIGVGGASIAGQPPGTQNLQQLTRGRQGPRMVGPQAAQAKANRIARAKAKVGAINLKLGPDDFKNAAKINERTKQQREDANRAKEEFDQTQQARQPQPGAGKKAPGITMDDRSTDENTRATIELTKRIEDLERNGVVVRLS